MKNSDKQINVGKNTAQHPKELSALRLYAHTHMLHAHIEGTSPFAVFSYYLFILFFSSLTLISFIPKSMFSVLV